MKADNENWILGYRLVNHVWNVKYITELHVPIIMDAVLHGPPLLHLPTPGSTIHAVYDVKNWIGCVIEPPVGHPGKGWVWGDIENYTWRNLGPVVDLAEKLGL